MGSPELGCTCPASPCSCSPGAAAAAGEGLQHSWHTAALTPAALFTRIRMQVGLAAGLAACRRLFKSCKRKKGRGRKAPKPTYKGGRMGQEVPCCCSQQGRGCFVLVGLLSSCRNSLMQLRQQGCGLGGAENPPQSSLRAHAAAAASTGEKCLPNFAERGGGGRQVGSNNSDSLPWRQCQGRSWALSPQHCPCASPLASLAPRVPEEGWLQMATKMEKGQHRLCSQCHHHHPAGFESVTACRGSSSPLGEGEVARVGMFPSLLWYGEAVGSAWVRAQLRGSVVSPNFPCSPVATRRASSSPRCSPAASLKPRLLLSLQAPLETQVGAWSLEHPRSLASFSRSSLLLLLPLLSVSTSQMLQLEGGSGAHRDLPVRESTSLQS